VTWFTVKHACVIEVWKIGRRLRVFPQSWMAEENAKDATYNSQGQVRAKQARPW